MDDDKKKPKPQIFRLPIQVLYPKRIVGGAPVDVVKLAEYVELRTEKQALEKKLANEVKVHTASRKGHEATHERYQQAMTALREIVTADTFTGAKLIAEHAIEVQERPASISADVKVKVRPKNQ